MYLHSSIRLMSHISIYNWNTTPNSADGLEPEISRTLSLPNSQIQKANAILLLLCHVLSDDHNAELYPGAFKSLLSATHTMKVSMPSPAS